MAVLQTPDDLERHLRDELSILRDAAEGYDAGRTYQYKTIATSVRKLFHDTAMSQSLLGQLGVKGSWTWIDTGEEIDPLNLLVTYGLVQMTVSWPEGDGQSTTSYSPWLDAFPRVLISRQTAFSRTPISRTRGSPLPVRRWWTRGVLKDLRGNMFSRSDLVLKVANQDGGAHVGPLTGSYPALARDGSLSIPVHEDDGSTTLSTESPVPASLRQIGFEVIETIEHFRPDLG